MWSSDALFNFDQEETTTTIEIFLPFSRASGSTGDKEWLDVSKLITDLRPWKAKRGEKFIKGNYGSKCH